MTANATSIHEASWICPITAEPIRDGAIAVHRGLIVGVGAQAEMRELPGTRVRHPKGAAIVPGFVNAHSHLELTLLRGFIENAPFFDWIHRLVEVKYQSMSQDALLVSAQLGAIENLRAGVTAIGEVMDSGTAWQAMREYGLQGVAYQEVFGPAPGMVEDSFRGLQTKVAAHRSAETETLRVGVSPHAPYTVSEPLYRATLDYARAERLPMAVHLAESRDETAFVRDGAGRFAEAHRARGIPVTARGVTPVSYLDQLGLLGPDTLLIHAIEIDDFDLERIHATDSRVAHCPKSNAKLGHRVARIVEMRERKIPVGLGSDSVASNNVVDMFEEMRGAIFQQRVATGHAEILTARDAFRMATIDGAQCLGLAHKLGSLEAGKRADFAVIDLGAIATQPVYDPIETMVFSACRANVRETYVGGVAFRTDESNLLRRAEEIAATLL